MKSKVESAALKSKAAEDCIDPPGVVDNQSREGCSDGARSRGLRDGRLGGFLNHCINGAKYDLPKQPKNGQVRAEWVDEVGGKLRKESSAPGVVAGCCSKGGNPSFEDRGASEHRKGKSECFALKLGQASQIQGKVSIEGSRFALGGRSFKETLLLHQPKKDVELPSSSNVGWTPVVKRKRLVRPKEGGEVLPVPSK